MLELSIIIVSFNTCGILRDSLESVFDNSPEFDFEVIVIDNNSHDGSAEMVEREYPQVRLVRNSDNRGFAAANNQGFAIAEGRYWLMLNSDTLVLGDVLSRSVEYMRHRPDVGMMGCRVLNCDMSVQETCFRWPSLLNIAILSIGLGRVFPNSKFLKRERMRGWMRDSEREVDSITGCYLLVSSEAAGKVGLLDEDFFFYGEETDWCRRFAEGGYQVMFAPVGEIIHLGGASGEAMHYSRKLMLSQAMVRLQRKHNGIIAGIIAWWLLLIEVGVKSFGFGVAAILQFGRFYPVFKKHFGALMKFYKAWPGRGRQVKKRVLAVASSGGHWMQLRRLESVFERYDTCYASTRDDYRREVIGARFVRVCEVSRWKKLRIPFALLQMFWVVLRVRPDVVISTGAMPGLLAVFFGRIMGARCIWLDSIANSEELSLSGKVAGKFVQLWLTQWEDLAGDDADKGKPEYAGKVL